MIKVHIPEPYPENTIDVSKVKERTPIFAYRDGELVGLVVNINGGWGLALGGQYFSNGFHNTRDQLLTTCKSIGYTFFINERV